MSEILFLSHRPPFPPNKGEKIRAYHLLAGLCAQHRVHLGCLIDEDEDWRHTEHLQRLCAETCFAPLRRSTAGSALRALVNGEAVSIAHHRHPELAAWVRATLQARRPSCAYVMSSAMAQFLDPTGFSPPRTILDFVDVDAEKWRLYAADSRWPFSWLYRREAEQLLRHDRAAGQRFDLCLFVSEAEAGRFRALAPELGSKIRHLVNGVDADYFSPGRDYPDPFDGGLAVVFTGTMSYRPNEEAAIWFAREVMPRLRQSVPSLRFAIVGRDPSRRLGALDGRDGVMLTGTVPDPRPYLAHAAAVVVPLLHSPGVANKVLEGMAMAKPVVATPQAVSGLNLVDGRDTMIAADAEAFVNALAKLLADGTPPSNLEARARVLADFTWAAAIAELMTLIQVPDAKD